MAPTDKKSLRAHLLQARADLGEDQRRRSDEAIAGQVRRLRAWQTAGVVYTYLSFGIEVDTRGLIRDAWRQGKTVALPRCVAGTRRMRWYVVTSLDGLERNGRGMEEPPAQRSAEVDPGGSQDAVALVPGLAFDAAGHRLGYGGGFYDTFLPGFAGTSIGLCRKATLVDELPFLEAHDVPVDLVITEYNYMASIHVAERVWDGFRSSGSQAARAGQELQDP